MTEDLQIHEMSNRGPVIKVVLVDPKKSLDILMERKMAKVHLLCHKSKQEQGKLHSRCTVMITAAFPFAPTGKENSSEFPNKREIDGDRKVLNLLSPSRQLYLKLYRL